MFGQTPTSGVAFWLKEGMVCLLAAGSLFVVGRFVNAFAAFILLPVAVGFVTVRLFHHLPGDSRPARWPALLAREHPDPRLAVEVDIRRLRNLLPLRL